VSTTWKAGLAVGLLVLGVAGTAALLPLDGRNGTPKRWPGTGSGTSRAAAGGCNCLDPSAGTISVFNVKTMYGAAGDGATDDTTPIQNALTAAATTGGIVYFPRGAYLFGSTLSPAAGVSMMGDGGGAPVFGVSAATILKRTADVVGIQMLKAGTRVENIELTASTPGTTDGIWIGLETDTTTNGCSNGSLRNVSVHGVGGSGIFGKNGNVVRLDNVSSCNNGGWGLKVDSTTGNCEAWAITGLATHNNRSGGAMFGWASGHSIQGLEAEGNAGPGLEIHGVGITATGVWLEANAVGYNLSMVAGSSGNVVVGYCHPAQGYNLGSAYNFITLHDSLGLPVAQTPYGQMLVRRSLTTTRVTPPYGTKVPIHADSGNEFTVTATDGAGFMISSPSYTTSSMGAGQRITVRVKNASGGALGRITWGSGYKMAEWTNPASGHSRSIDFQDDGTHWVEVSRTPSDVPN
jgi:hypothetical protein